LERVASPCETGGMNIEPEVEPADFDGALA